jgi:hypothetical protein
MSGQGTIARMKQRWRVQSTARFWLIMLVFSLAGMSVVRAKPYIFELLHVPGDLPWWIDIPIWLLTVFPAYQVLLLLWAAVFGQWSFFWEKEKKMAHWFGRKLRLVR